MKSGDIYKREDCEICPNSFAMFWDDKEQQDKFIMSFANTIKEEERVDILSEVILNRHGFTLIFRKMLEVMAEYSSKKHIDLLAEVFEEIEGEN